VRARAVREPEARAALLVGLSVAFVSGVWMVRAIRPGILLDADPSWAAARAVLGLGLAAGATAAGALAAGLFGLWARTASARADLARLPFTRGAVAVLALSALCLGAALRLAALERIPESLFLDDVSLIEPTLALEGVPQDFADAIRPVPYGVEKLFGTVGVLYLEAFRASLSLFGTTVTGLRLPSAIAGILSLLTAMALGRALLPRGGGALGGLILAGLRWHLIASRWGWNMIALAPLLDVAALLALRGRRRGSVPSAAAAGAVAGIGAHVYLSAWSGAAGLGLLLLWPGASGRLRRRIATAAAFGAGFLLAVAPLFLLREERTIGYFARTGDHNLLREVRYNRSALPAFAVAADALASPWLVPDPTSRQEIPGKNRLGIVLGFALAVAFGRALLRPREDLSAFLLCGAIAALASTIAGGQSGNPNGARFAYLTTAAAVGVAAGLLALLAAVPEPRRRIVALVAIGAVAIIGTLAARDALLRWPERHETFAGFHGADTRIGRAAARWERFGTVRLDSELGHSPVTSGAVRRYRLDPDEPRWDAVFGPRSASRPDRQIVFVRPGYEPESGARLVERVTDPRGKIWAEVWASASPAAR
jgi:hypothetical protein